MKKIIASMILMLALSSACRNGIGEKGSGTVQTSTPSGPSPENGGGAADPAAANNPSFVDSSMYNSDTSLAETTTP